MLCEQVARQDAMPKASRAVSAPLDRRSFMMCALASGAALGAGEFAAPATASPSELSSMGQQTQNDAQFAVEACLWNQEATQVRRLRGSVRHHIEAIE